MKHFISLKYLSKEEILKLIRLSLSLKKNPSHYQNKLKAKFIGLLFEKPSLRTKTAFYLATYRLGGMPIYYSPFEVKLREREKISDVSRTLSKFLDAIVLRTFSHQSILEFARFSSIPVINGLSDSSHPSQVLADLLTIYQLRKEIKKLKISYIGDGNNICHSLIYAFSILGGNLTVATPFGYEPKRDILTEAQGFAKKSKASLYVCHNPKEAAENADVLYTDVWTSMGKEEERVLRKKVFKGFQLNANLLKLAKENCLIMHCLPAHRQEEITDSVLEGKNSVVFLQAENRLYSAEAILIYCLEV